MSINSFMGVVFDLKYKGEKFRFANPSFFRGTLYNHTKILEIQLYII